MMIFVPLVIAWDREPSYDLVAQSVVKVSHISHVGGRGEGAEARTGSKDACWLLHTRLDRENSDKSNDHHSDID